MIDEKILLEQIKTFKRSQKSTNCDYLTGYISALSAVEGMIAEQPKVGEWIPFKGREADEEERRVYGCDMILTGEFPDEDEDILVTYASGKVGSDAFLRDGYECYLDSGAAFGTEAIAWMTLPEPYKGVD